MVWRAGQSDGNNRRRGARVFQTEIEEASAELGWVSTFPVILPFKDRTKAGGETDRDSQL